MQVKVLSGISGAGKSTWTKARFKEIMPVTGKRVEVYSADFVHYVDEGEYRHFLDESEYIFRPELLAQGHATCLREFAYALMNGSDCDGKTVIVDNTSTTHHELAPYVALAQAYGHEVEVVMFIIDPLQAFRRAKASGHHTPLNVIMRQDVQLRETLRTWLSRWPLTIKPADGVFFPPTVTPAGVTP